jgi:hypothetical protein
MNWKGWERKWWQANLKYCRGNCLERLRKTTSFFIEDSLCSSLDMSSKRIEYVSTATQLHNFALYVSVHVGVHNVIWNDDACRHKHYQYSDEMGMRQSVCPPQCAGGGGGAADFTKNGAMCVCTCNHFVINERTTKSAERNKNSMWCWNLCTQPENTAYWLF